MRWSPPEQNAQPPSFGLGPLPVSSTTPMRGSCRAIVERPVQLVDGVRTERVAHLGPVERDARDAAVRRHVRGDVGVALGAGGRHPFVLVEQVGNAHRHSLRRRRPSQSVMRRVPRRSASYAGAVNSTPRTLVTAAAAALLLALSACSATPAAEPYARSLGLGVRAADAGECAGVRVVVETGDLEVDDGPAGSTCIDTDEAIAAGDAVDEAGLTLEGTDEYGDQVVCRVNGVPAEDFALTAEDGIRVLRDVRVDARRPSRTGRCGCSPPAASGPTPRRVCPPCSWSPATASGCCSPSNGEPAAPTRRDFPPRTAEGGGGPRRRLHRGPGRCTGSSSTGPTASGPVVLAAARGAAATARSRTS